MKKVLGFGVGLFFPLAMRLGSYRFGRIEVDGVPYHEDLWVCGERMGRWRRREGHRVHPEDLAEVLALSPEVVVIRIVVLGCSKSRRKR